DNSDLLKMCSHSEKLAIENDSFLKNINSYLSNNLYNNTALSYFQDLKFSDKFQYLITFQAKWRRNRYNQNFLLTSENPNYKLKNIIFSQISKEKNNFNFRNNELEFQDLWQLLDIV
ncbi:unnamed protein product, partial [Gordionus sp. m RMFG-2023]